MWRRAKTTTQKMAVLDGFLPITADDFVKAVVYFSGDDDEFVWKKASEKLKDISLKDIKKHIDSDLPEKSALAILRYAGDKKDSSLIISLMNIKKIHPQWVLTYVQIHDEDFWRTLVTHRDFIALSIPLQDEFISFFSEFSIITTELYKEQIGYLSEEEKEQAALDDTDKEKISEYETETSEKEDEDEEVVNLDFDDIDFPDFLLAEEAFEGLTLTESIEKKKNLSQMIKDMSIGEKVKLATVGNFEVRKLLIKDPRRIIAMAVLDNAKITEKEILSIASDNAATTDIIGHIAKSKSLSRNYRVKLALVLNPKTPLKIAMAYLDVLRMNDIKRIANSRDVSSTIKMKARKKVK